MQTNSAKIIYIFEYFVPYKSCETVKIHTELRSEYLYLYWKEAIINEKTYPTFVESFRIYKKSPLKSVFINYEFAQGNSVGVKPPYPWGGQEICGSHSWPSTCNVSGFFYPLLIIDLWEFSWCLYFVFMQNFQIYLYTHNCMFCLRIFSKYLFKKTPLKIVCIHHKWM